MSFQNLATISSLALLLACTPNRSASNPEKLGLPVTASDCLKRGGEWIERTKTTIFFGCILDTTDGGKACASSSECQSECVEREAGNVCADSYSGCFAPTGRGTVTQCVN